MEITKTTVECYKLRGLPLGAWADINIDAKDEYGRIQIASDYGDYQYFWSHCGMSFKKFLTTVSIDYVAGKFKQDRYPDIESTLKNYREQVIEYRKLWNMDKKRARKIYDEIKTLEDVGGETEFYFNIQDCSELMKFYDGMPEIGRTIHPRFQNFWNEIWSVFIKHIKEELRQEQAVI